MSFHLSVTNTYLFLHIVMTIILFLSALIFPIIFLLNMPALTRQLIAAIGFTVSAIVTISILFIPKVLKFIDNNEKNEDIAKRDSRSAKINPEAAVGGLVITSKANKAATMIESDKAIVNSEAALKGLSMDDKARVCIDQISKWQGTLLRLSELDTRTNSYQVISPKLSMDLAVLAAAASRQESLALGGGLGSMKSPNESIYSPNGANGLGEINKRIDEHSAECDEEGEGV